MLAASMKDASAVKASEGRIGQISMFDGMEINRFLIFVKASGAEVRQRLTNMVNFSLPGTPAADGANERVAGHRPNGGCHHCLFRRHVARRLTHAGSSRISSID
jgi:hypothetical protein